MTEHNPARRDFLQAGIASAAALAMPLMMTVPRQAAAATAFSAPSFDLSQGARRINWLREATGEHLHITYLTDGAWHPGAYDDICHVLRDVQAKEAVQMDRRLIAILDWMGAFLRQYGYIEPIHILSGYRTRKTNSRLENAAKNSLHMHAMAADIYVPGVSPVYLGKLLRWLSAGGVGVYPTRHFVHVDPGRVRAWVG
jgi:uncharacterized protein YcbK (DUF882 family)